MTETLNAKSFKFTFDGEHLFCHIKSNMSLFINNISWLTGSHMKMFFRSATSRSQLQSNQYEQ